MYRFRSISDSQWEIVDDDDRVLFVGSPRECEDLLDRAENLESRASWLQGLLDLLLHPLRDHPDKTPDVRPTSVGRQS